MVHMREYLLHWPCNACSKSVSQSTLLMQSETIFYLFLFQGKHEFYFTSQILCPQFLICFPTKAEHAFTQQKNHVLWYLVQTTLWVIFIKVQLFFLSAQISTFRTTLLCFTLISAPLLIPLTSYHNLFFFLFPKFFSSFSLLLPERCFEDIPGFLFSIPTDRLVIFLQPLSFYSIFFHPTPSSSLYCLMLFGIMTLSNLSNYLTW